MKCVLLSDNLLGHWGRCQAKVNLTQLLALWQFLELPLE